MPGWRRYVSSRHDRQVGSHLSCCGHDVANIRVRGNRHEQRARMAHSCGFEDDGLTGVAVDDRYPRRAGLPHATVVELDQGVWQMQRSATRAIWQAAEELGNEVRHLGIDSSNRAIA